MSKFKLPKTYTVKGAKYKIKLVDTDMFAGMCDPQKKIIYISIHQSKEQIEHTFYHEVNHALQFEIGINQAVSRETMEILAENQASLQMDLARLSDK